MLGSSKQLSRALDWSMTHHGLEMGDTVCKLLDGGLGMGFSTVESWGLCREKRRGSLRRTSSYPPAPAHLGNILTPASLFVPTLPPSATPLSAAEPVLSFPLPLFPPPAAFSLLQSLPRCYDNLQ